MKDYFEYTCVGNANVKRATVLVSASVVSAMLLGVASVGESVFSPCFALASAVFFFLAVLIFVRFIGTRYSYKLIIYPSGEGDLLIAELRGVFGRSSDVKVNRTVCRISVDDITDFTVITSGDCKSTRKELKKKLCAKGEKIYNYTSAPFLNEFAVIRIEDADGVSYVRFSPDEELIRLLRSCSSR